MLPPLLQKEILTFVLHYILEVVRLCKNHLGSCSKFTGETCTFMHNKFDRSTAFFPNIIPKLQISKENSIFTKGFTLLQGLHKWELEMEEWAISRAKQVIVVVFPMCKILRKLSILLFSHSSFLQSRVPYHKYMHLLMMWSKMQDYVNSRWFFTYSVEYVSAVGTVCGDLDLIRRLPFVKSSASNTHLFLSGHHLFTYVQDFFSCLCVFRSDRRPCIFTLSSAG